jgi:hypothetical protein
MTSNRDFSPLYLSKILAMFDGREKFAAIPLMVKDSHRLTCSLMYVATVLGRCAVNYWASCQE